MNPPQKPLVIPFSPSLSTSIPFQPHSNISLVSSSRRQEAIHHFCGNPQGWGPLTAARDNLTPCFLDASIGVFAVVGIVLGVAAVVYLARQKVQKKPLFKSWNFVVRLILLCSLIGITAAQAILVLIENPAAAVQNVQFWSPVVVLLSLLVISIAQYIENWRSRCANAIVLIYWSFFILFYGIKTVSQAGYTQDPSRTAELILHHVAFVISILVMTHEWTIPLVTAPLIKPGPEAESPRVTADIFSKLIFSWATPLMKYGYKTTITEKDLYSLREVDASGDNGSRFEAAWQKELQRKKPYVWLAIIRAFGAEYGWAGLNEFINMVLGLVQPLILQYFIRWVSSQKSEAPQPYSWGITLALLMFLTSTLQTIASQQNAIQTVEVGTHVKTALQVKLYKKALRLSSQARGSRSTGDIVNYMSVDTQKFMMLIRFGNMIWSAPLTFGLAMWLLYRLLGVAMFAGIAVTVLVTPLNGLVVHFSNHFSTQGMKAKDARTSLTTEIIENMKYIKLYAWSAAYMERLKNIRDNQELKYMRYENMFDSGFEVIWSMPRYLVAGLTFIVYVLTQSRPLTSDLIFPALALFNMLNFPLSVLPALLAIGVESSVSAKRLNEFFCAEELQTDAIEHREAVTEASAESVAIRAASFTPSKNEEKTLLDIKDFSAKAGQLTCIIGTVGSGKSSLLSAILGDLYRKDGTVIVHGRIAYAPQTPWIMNATVKDNILFGRPFSNQLYDRVLKACALLPDLSSLPNGDKTEVGERGIALSGGQKARLSLARAVYAQADVYLLDDCLAAVDEHVSKHLIEQVIGPTGMLKNRARILATNTTRVLKSANTIYFVEEGKITSTGTLKNMLAQGGSVTELIKSLAKEEQTSEGGSGDKTPDVTITEAASSSETPIDFTKEVDPTDADKLLAAVVASSAGVATTDPQMDVFTEEFSAATESTPLLMEDKANGVKAVTTIAEEDREVAAGKKVETSAKGKVKWIAYVEYIKACGVFNILLWVIAMLLAQTFALGSGLWIKHWADLNDRDNTNVQPAFYIGLYFALGVASAALSGMQAFILRVTASLRAGKIFHERMATSVFRSPMSFFETTPAGQIMNRFSSDINKVDKQMIHAVSMVIENLLYVFFTLGVVCWTTPFFLLLILPMAVACFYLQQFYIRSTRETSRLEASTKSPIFSHFQESLAGVSSIRAYGKQYDFGEENESRIDANLRSFYCFVTSNRFVLLRLEVLGSLVVGGAAGLAVAAIAAGYNSDAGSVGLALSFAFQITQSLSWLVRMTVELENNMVCVERLLEYTNLPSEAAEYTDTKPSKDWPSKGEIVIKDYSVRYREGLPLVLDGINLSIKPGERIGIVGRTGAGKSTLTLALFRIIEGAGGKIEIDGLDTNLLGLTDLRSNLSIIPQDGMVIQGTIRHNLDPAGKYDDIQLWQALEYAQLKEHISNMEGKLDAEVQAGGQNLSQGQRQLMSLARVLLNNSKVLVLDEATSAIDSATDTILQQTLRSDVFAGRTIVTIAHRINTIVDSDRVVVLDRGKVAEFASPSELVAKGGLFKDLVKEAGLLERFENGQ